MNRFTALLVALALALLSGGAALIFTAGERLTRPATRSIGEPPADFAARTVRIAVGPDQFVAGWFATDPAARGAVLLLHGVRADRTQMLARARFLLQAGYSTLLIDLPAHGESSGERITFGANEAAGVTAAVSFLRHKLPGERLGIIGVSLGAAAIVLARLDPAPDAVVLESMYPTIEEALSNRLGMRLGSPGAALAPLLLWQLPARTGVNAGQLRPIERLSHLGAPVMVATGADDRHTTWAETERLFGVAQEPKELWRIADAAHVDLHAHRPQEYQRRVLQFMARYVRGER